MQERHEQALPRNESNVPDRCGAVEALYTFALWKHLKSYLVHI